MPWSERLRPGDIGPGDVLPFAPDDPRLEPGYVPTGDEEEDRVAIEELALARARVLSPLGKDQAADRWYAGTRGPTAPGALAAAAPCGSCGFLVRMSGSLGTVFGVFGSLLFGGWAVVLIALTVAVLIVDILWLITAFKAPVRAWFTQR